LLISGPSSYSNTCASDLRGLRRRGRDVKYQ